MSSYQFGMVGLGVMGRNLLLNMADHGYSVAGFDLSGDQVAALAKEAGDRQVKGTTDIKEFVGLLKTPRAVMMLVPAGPPVDSVIKSLLPLVAKGDLIIDGGNSFFKDTDLRSGMLKEKGVHFFGMGVSGGEEGARHGPSMMPGGPREAYEVVQKLLEDCSAHVNGEPCVAWLGPRSAGHYVKMVHNGIEYGLMQLLGECYDVMKRGLGMSNAQMHDVFEKWNEEDTGGFLVEITQHILAQKDDRTGKDLVDMIKDVTYQKGTGMWTSEDAMRNQTGTPTIHAAVAARDLSTNKDERVAASKVLKGPASSSYSGEAGQLLAQLQRAFHAAQVLTYAQGMNLLAHASKAYDYGLDLANVSKIWRGGCIIRSKLLEPMMQAYKARPDLANLLLDAKLGGLVQERQGDLRKITCVGVELGLPLPGFAASIAYFDGYRSQWLPANLIEAQRDYFGAHTYDRIDEKGKFHTHWTAD